ncbi:conserved hypothetical protein [uncultured Paludibacter sp.]|uniref:Uncharacterized protein n=1 Tax=uncultured Paludibacter sp. TaxID=497635 RepID=A0A653AIR6_9BACT|nr:conserved hypothetical protein [uncultured Paludibacter sp.]
MDDETKNCCKSGNRNAAAGGGAVYGLGLIGAAVYFISHAATFWLGVLGFVKAIVWPAFLVYDAFKYLGN